MKILVCTSEGQGARDNDFCWTNEGEAALVGERCDSHEKGSVDGSCGCGRALMGLETRKASTTVRVAEVDFDHEVFKQRIRTSTIKAGFGDLGDEYLEEMATYMEEQANRWPVGTVVELREKGLQERQVSRKRSS